MGWTVLLVVLAQVQAGECVSPAKPEGPPALVVQVVDQLWLPIPGALVRVIPASASGERREVRSGREGYAEFWLPSEAEDTVEASLEHFKAKRVKGVRAGKPSNASPTAYVQLQLVFSGPTITIE